MADVSTAEIELELLRAMEKNRSERPHGMKSALVLREAIKALGKWPEAASDAVCNGGDEDSTTRCGNWSVTVSPAGAGIFELLRGRATRSAGSRKKA